MKFKNWLLKEEYLKTGSAIIYHRTRKEALSGIVATGFQVGGGAMYGKGFYATLDLESQNNDYMLNSYGDTITKWFIPHLNHFVIFNPILANMVHGTSSIEEQLKKIVGENLPQLDANVSNYKISQRTAPSALKFSQDYLQKLNPQQKDKIAGLIFSGENDGNVFVAYNNDEIIFNGFFYAPSIMDSKQLNELKTGHGWESRVGVERIKDVYQMPNYDKRSRLAKELELEKDKKFNKHNEDKEKLKLLNSQLINRAENGNLRAVEYLIKKGANNFQVAMRSAVEGGYLDIVKLMIEKGANNFGAYDFEHAMIKAVKNGNLDIVKLMIEKGANNFRGAFDTAMVSAARGGYLDIVKLIIEKGASISLEAMRSAVEGGYLDIVKLMIEKGADDFTISNALNNAAREGQINIVKYLFGKTANSSNSSVMRYAIYGGHLDVVEYLIDKVEYDLNDLNDIMAKAVDNGKLDIVKFLIEKGANDFNEAMIDAARSGHLEIVKLMIEKGANKFNEPIQAALNNGQLDIVDYIKQAKSDQSQSTQQPAQQPAQPVRNPWLSRMRSKVGI